MLKALCDYYDILAKGGKVAPIGYTLAEVSHIIHLDESGEILDVNTLDETKKMVVPLQEVRTSGKRPFFLCDNAAYFLGIDAQRGEQWAEERHELSVRLHRQLLSAAKCEPAKAILKFFDQLSTVLEEKNDLLKPLQPGFIVFCVNGEFAHENENLKKVWEDSIVTDAQIRTCCITGEKVPIAQVHPRIKHLPGTTASGAALVSFLSESSKSFGLKGGNVGPVGAEAAQKYAGALNYLLDSEYALHYDDLTVVFWADSPDESYQSTFQKFLNPKMDGSDDALIDTFLDNSGGLDLNTDFFIFGLSGQAGRASVQFFMSEKFGRIISNITHHYELMSLEHAPWEPKYVPFWMLLQSISRPTARGKYPPKAIMCAILKSILCGEPYPYTMYSCAIQWSKQIKADYYRTAIINAYLKRRKAI